MANKSLSVGRIENLLKDEEFQHKVKSIEELSIDEITETINDLANYAISIDQNYKMNMRKQ